jgi:hypothetical protein
MGEHIPYGPGRKGQSKHGITTYAISAYHYQYSEFESVYDKGFTITFVRLVVFAGYSGFLHR